MNKGTLILASASPRRSEMLRQAGLVFETMPSGVEETLNEGLSAGELAQVNAYRKARAVSKRFPDAVILGVDTLVALKTQVFGKPASRAEAQRMLAALQGRTHQVVTGVCLVHLREHRQKMFVEQTDVTFRPLRTEQIKRYHAKVDPLDKAGAYGIQEHGDWLVESVSGSFSNVVGLPLERTLAELKAFERAATTKA